MTELPDVKLRALVNFPVAVTGRTGINVVKIAGHYYIDLDVSGFVQNANIPADQVAGKFVTVWDSAADSYQNIPYSLVATAGVTSIHSKTGALDIGNGLTFTGDTLETDASTIQFDPGVTGGFVGDLRTRGRFSLYVMDFIPKALWAGIEAGTETTDLYAYELAARNRVAGLSMARRLIYPSGRYYRSLAPNWAIADAEIVAEGEARIRYTGTGNAVELNGLPGGIFNTKIKNFIVEAPSTAASGFAAFAAHKALFEGCKVLGCGSGAAGFYAEWCVGATWDRPIVSINDENGWFGGAKPLVGMQLTRNGSGGNYTSYCNIINAYMEGTDIGVLLDYTFGNNFFGGALEGCATVGLQTTTHARGDKVRGLDFEANPASDITLGGQETEIDGCDTATGVFFTATSGNCQLKGGQHQNISIDAAAGNSQVMDLTYNKLGSGNFNNSSDSTYYRDITNKATGLLYQDAARIISVTSSPQDVTVRRNIQMVSVQGGTVSKISLVRSGVAHDLSATSGVFTVGPGDALRIESTIAPTVQAFPFTA